MATLLEDLTDIEEKAQGLVENKVANFAYTQEAYDTDDVAGVSEYDVNKAQNIPTADAETLDVNPTVLNKGYRSQASSITRMLMNHFLGRISYNLNKSVDIFKKGFLAIKNAMGKPNGLATLDSTGRIPDSQSNCKLKDIFSHLLGRFWTQSNITSGSFNIATYANGVWVAGSGSSSDSGLYYSQDGITWTQSNITSGILRAVTYANGIWVASSGDSGLYYSQDGITWTQSNITSGYFNIVTYANGIWVASSGDSGLYYSDINTLIKNGWLVLSE